MDPVPGWYVDPGGVPGQLRWWDGGAWTAHVAPAPPRPATPDGPGTEPLRPLARGDAPAATGTAEPSEGESAAQQPPSGAAGPRVGSAVIVAAVAAVALLALVVAILTGAFGSGPGPREELRVGDTTTGEIGPGDTWTADLEIEPGGTVLIDVRGEPGFDAVVEVLGDDGRLLGRNDDRLQPGVDEVGGDRLDPLLEVDLAPGSYQVEVTGFHDSNGSFELSIS